MSLKFSFLGFCFLIVPVWRHIFEILGATVNVVVVMSLVEDVTLVWHLVVAHLHEQDSVWMKALLAFCDVA
jgi:hypothetical protein